MSCQAGTCRRPLCHPPQSEPRSPQGEWTSRWSHWVVVLEELSRFLCHFERELDMIWTYILKDLESIANTSGGNKATKKKAHFNCNSMHFACSQTRVTGSIEMAEIHWDWMLTCWHVDRLIHSLGPTSSCSEKVKKHTANIMERIGNWDCHLMILMLSLMQFACGLHMFALVSHFRSCFHLGPCTRGDRKESNKATRSSFREDVTKWKIRKLCFFCFFFQLRFSFSSEECRTNGRTWSKKGHITQLATCGLVGAWLIALPKW